MNTRSLALLASLSLLAGCKTVHVLGPDQLQRLDGYDATDLNRQPLKLETKAGEFVTFTPNAQLTFLRPSSTARTGHIQRITARPDLLVATLAGGRTFSVDLQPVTEVRLVTPAPWKTALLVAGSILLGGALISGLTYLTLETVRVVRTLGGAWGGRWF